MFLTLSQTEIIILITKKLLSLNAFKLDPSKTLWCGKVLKYVQRTISVEFIDCMVLNAIFNSISVISQQPVLISMLSWSYFNQYSAQYSFQATGCSPTTIIETTDRGERGMNLVAMTIINPRKEYWPCRGLNQ